MSTLTIFIQHSFGSPGHCSQRRKRKEIQIGEEEVNLSLFAEDMIPCIEKPKDATRKILELINEFSKGAGYKINTQKSIALTTKDQKEKLRKQSHLPSHKKNKIHRKKPTYRDKNLYFKNYNMLMKKIKDDTNSCTHCYI